MEGSGRRWGWRSGKGSCHIGPIRTVAFIEDMESH